MLKTKHKIGFALLATAASALTACGKTDKLPPGTVLFWSSFGGAYTSILNNICSDIKASKGLEIKHESQGSYDEINRNMISAIAVGDYPHIAMGYPDHFATYLSSGILTPLDDYFTDAEFSDYYDSYMKENKFYDNGGQNAKLRTYAVPFNKSTEVLGYNGVFVDYCASVQAEYGYSGLETLPNTWAEWEVQLPKYNAIFTALMNSKKCVYGVQDPEGKASSFEVADLVTTVDEDGDVARNGKKLLLDFSKADPKTSVLMSWDATDNAFITLVRQWGAQYTVLPETEKVKVAKKRVGQVMFNSSDNQGTVIDMLQFFNKLNKQRLFGIPSTLGGSYSSDAFAQCKVMFMICSSGGLSYNTANWHHRFRVRPIPYKDANNKAVISQGANICLTNRGEIENSIKTLKALTTHPFQTKWCLETGYYPCSKSSLESKEYQDFLTEDKRLPAEQAYASGVRVAYREGSQVNNEHYMNAEEGWDKFVDPAFKGSSDLRTAVKDVFASVFTITNVDDRSEYKSKLDDLENVPALKSSSTITFIH